MIGNDATNQRFCEAIARALDTWAEEATAAVSEPNKDLLAWREYQRAVDVLRSTIVTTEQTEALRVVIYQAMVGLLDSVMLVLDNASHLADFYTMTITTSTGEVLGPGLNETFMAHLYETGRMR